MFPPSSNAEMFWSKEHLFKIIAKVLSNFPKNDTLDTVEEVAFCKNLFKILFNHLIRAPGVKITIHATSNIQINLNPITGVMDASFNLLFTQARNLLNSSILLKIGAIERFYIHESTFMPVDSNAITEQKILSNQCFDININYIMACISYPIRAHYLYLRKLTLSKSEMENHLKPFLDYYINLFKKNHESNLIFSHLKDFCYPDIPSEYRLYAIFDSLANV